jgi:membrane protease YdiL (CAAX protease family)
LLLVVLTGGAASLVSLLLIRGLGMPKDGPFSAVGLALALGGMMAVYALAVHFGEKRPVTELALKFLAPELAAGLLGGALLFSVVMALLVAVGAYSLGGPSYAPPWRGLQVGFGPGFAEELIFRGILMRLLWESFGARVALAVSATLFGLAHLLNPGHAWIGPVSIIFEAGLPLGALYLLTGRLWASIGAHVGWNFAQGYIYGAEVSGADVGGHLFHAVEHAGVSPLLTGGAFGPEASVAGLAVGTVAGVVLLAWAVRRRADAVWTVP